MLNSISTRLIQLLLDAGFNPCVVDRKGWTALHYASQSNRHDGCEAVSIIIEAIPNNALVHMKNLDGNTALHIASMNRYGEDIATSLLLHDARVSDRNVKMETPLHVSVRAEANAIAGVLCQAGADPLIMDMKHRTSIHAA
ncbi:ankyrin repeat-containing domain protein, partial [Baffinella frigidus]